LEFLKLNDSIIRSFRDIGTSFKNVRILHLGRCELKNIQGIQVFEQLEELYIGYNEIDSLFDISFIEYLSVLDFEGNNIKDIDQLIYLKRCTELTHVNMKNNPLELGAPQVFASMSEDISTLSLSEKRIEYYKRMKQNVPLIEELDDEEVNDNEMFFDKKILQVKEVASKTNPKEKTDIL
jgi:Leucine-rich repeat (LRR) protein